MTEKIEQLEAGLASDLNRELEALLPLAAKALGRELGTDGDFYILKQKKPLVKDGDCYQWDSFEPYFKNNDAMKLAVDLRMSIYCAGVDKACATAYANGHIEAYADFDDRPREVAIRMAILRCAAEIGKQISV